MTLNWFKWNWIWIT